MGAQSLLCLIENLLNLSKLSLEVEDNKIYDIETYYLFNFLSNLKNLSSLYVKLANNF